MEIPVLPVNRTVGTQNGRKSREWKDRCKRGRSLVGKSARQSEDVMRSELKVAKLMSRLPRNDALVY